jgi:subtilisin family serine protease
MAGLAFALYPILWLVEQFALAGGQEFGRGPWLVAGAVHGILILLPSLVALALTGDTRYRAGLTVCAWCGLFVLIALPVRLAGMSANQAATLLQIACAALYVAVLVIQRRREGRPLAAVGGLSGMAILAAVLVIWPWVLWGALGSWLDTALNLASAALFGLAVGLTLERLVVRQPDKAVEDQTLPFGLSVLIASVALLTMGVAFGASGQHIILLFLLPSLGWLAAALLHGSDERSGGGWLSTALLVGLVTAGPLLFIDPEELALILNLATRDVGFYALIATAISASMGLLAGLLVWLFLPRLANRWRSVAAVSLAAWAGLLALFIFAGQPGWYGERLYVILTDQSDLSAAATIADPAEQRAFVYQTLAGHADATQTPLQAAFDAVGISYTPYYLVNALEVDAGPLVRFWLETRPEVDRVLDSPELRPLPEPPPIVTGSAIEVYPPLWTQELIRAPRVWEEFGIRGAGIVIGQSDSGVDGAHPELRDQYRGSQPAGPVGNDYNWFDPWYGTTSPTDHSGHGTHTLATALGRQVGAAPDATWIGCVILARNLGNAPRYLDCLQFLLAPFPQDGDPLHDGRPDLGAHVLNNSWGCPEIEGCDAAALLLAVQALRAAGVFVVASAGNSGSACGSVSDPIALYDEVFTVGAIDENGILADFSSRGPVTADGSARIKPDVVAPGVNVLSAYPGGTYAYNDGTSMAGPHVVGVVALMWSANPALIGDIDRTEQILTETAKPYNQYYGVPECGDANRLPDNAVGYGIVDAYAAVFRALPEAD